MKKRTIIALVIALLMLVLLAACSGQEVKETETEQPSVAAGVTETQDAAEETEPPDVPEETAAVEQPKESTEIVMPENRDEVVAAMLTNPQQLYLGDIEKISRNDGGHIGNIPYENRCDDERMEIFTGNEGTAEVPFETKLRDFGSDSLVQQAVLVKFQPECADYLRFDFVGMWDYSIAFEEGEWWFVDVGNASKTAFSDYIPNNVVLDGCALYNILFATDADMNLRVMIWNDEDYQNQAYFETSLYQGMDDIYESNWKMNIFFGLNEDGFGQLNIYDYAVYTFDSFTDHMPTVAGS